MGYHRNVCEEGVRSIYLKGLEMVAGFLLIS